MIHISLFCPYTKDRRQETSWELRAEGLLAICWRPTFKYEVSSPMNSLYINLYQCVWANAGQFIGTHSCTTVPDEMAGGMKNWIQNVQSLDWEMCV